MWKLRDKYAIGGIGFTKFSKASGVTVLELATEACLKACQDAGINPDEVDGMLSFNFGDSVPGMAVATAMGLPNPQFVVEDNPNEVQILIDNGVNAFLRKQWYNEPYWETLPTIETLYDIDWN